MPSKPEKFLQYYFGIKYMYNKKIDPISKTRGIGPGFLGGGLFKIKLFRMEILCINNPASCVKKKHCSGRRSGSCFQACYSRRLRLRYTPPMSTFLIALLPVFGWGTWLAVSQDVRSPNPRAKTLYAVLANAAVSTLVFVSTGSSWDRPSFWPVFLGGLLWSVGGVAAFAASETIGLARGAGIWVPVNLAVGLGWGIFLFRELKGASSGAAALTAAAAAILTGGVLLILSARRGTASPPGEREDRKPGGTDTGRAGKGLLLAALAGLFFGTYFIPIRASGVSAWSAALPMSLGMAAGTLALCLVYPAPPTFSRPGHYLRSGLSGVLWAAGNYGMLLLTERIGTGRGFSIAQLNIIVSALAGIYVFREPPPGTRAARIVLAGCVIAAAGGVLLGLVK